MATSSSMTRVLSRRVEKLWSCHLRPLPSSVSQVTRSRLLLIEFLGFDLFGFNENMPLEIT